MIEWMTALLACQLAGEALAKATHLPVPGPVWGMALLFSGLVLLGRVPDELGRVANALLTNLSLLFVPAGVGIMLHLKLLAGEWLPLAAAVILSTLLTIAVTASLMTFFSRRRQQNDRP